MGKAIFWSVPAHGDTNPLLATIEELVNKGEKVIYYGTKEFKSIVEKTGAEYRIYKGNINNIDFELAENNMLGFMKSMLVFCLDKIENNLDDVIKEKPDYILHGSMSIWGKYLAQIFKIKAVNLIHSSPLSKEDIIFDWKMLFNFIFPLIGYIIKNRLNKNSLINRLKNKYNIKIDFTDLTANNEKMNIVYTSKFMTPDFGKNSAFYKLVGPSLYFKDDDNNDNLLFDKIMNAKENKKPVVYISLGTIHSNNPDFYNKCIKALGDKNMYVVLSCGSEINIDNLDVIPDNFIVRKKVPQQKLLKYTDVFILHSGMNSVNEALFYGVPLILLPHHIEQLSSAKRITSLGCGFYLNIQNINYMDILESVNKILEISSYKDNAVKYSKLVQRDEKKAHINAVNEILEYVR